MHRDQAQPGRGRVPVGPFGLGTASIGGLYSPVDDDMAFDVVAAAFEHGVTYFDTAPYYGFGTAERRLGAALAGRRRDDFVVSTKVGRIIVPDATADTGMFAGVSPAAVHFDFSAEGVRRSLATSLERLGLDRVDIVYLHDPDDHVDAALDEAYPELERWRDEKVVGAIGVGMNQTAIPTQFVRHTDIDAVLIAGRWTLLDQSALVDLLPACALRDVAVIVGGVFNSGILADPRATAMYDYAAAPRDVVERALAIERICADHAVSLRQAALGFVRLHPAVASVLIGARSVDELADALDAGSTPVATEVWRELAAQGWIADAVVPR